MNSNQPPNWDELKKKVQEKAEKLLKVEFVEALSWPPLSELPETIAKQNPRSIVFDNALSLKNCATPLEPSTSIQPEIDQEGNIINFIEENRSCDEFRSSTVSMSINREPFKHSNMSTNLIRGSSSNIPFAPGFATNLDDLVENTKNVKIAMNNEKETEITDFSELLHNVPIIGDVSFKILKNCAANSQKPTESFDIETMDIFDLLDFVSPVDISIPKTLTEQKSEEKNIEQVEELRNDVDEFLDKTESTTIFNENEKTKEKETTEILKKDKFAFAKRVEMTSKDEEEYKQLMPTMARKYPFILDPFQQSSILCMERNESLFVAAHTSAGKTVVAEYAIAMCKLHKTRAIYTSPIKALSNQKFRDFKQIFETVGLVTGDIQLHPEAFCIIMTTEILRSMLYNGSEVIRDLEWVVFDEVHYINNEERGHVWEEVLIMLPAHVKIVMLSATVPNCVEFADWVGRIKNRQINVISTNRRPVPLEHYLYTGQDGKTKKNLFKIIDRNGEFLVKGYNDAKESKIMTKEKKPESGSERGRGGGGGGRGGGGGGGGGRGAGFTGKAWPGKNDRNIYLNLINHMKEIDELPMVAFVFSRKRCDENAQLLKSMDLTSEVEKSHVHKFFAQCIDRLKGSDKELPQVLTMKELCLRGFAVHHSGILPILKEVVELLFQKGYVKILFATETFAMGVNMPARCVVFDSIEKHDGTSRRNLNPGEYTQMAGRAGRRGLDSTGTVIVLCKEATPPQQADLKQIMLGSALELKSKFRVTYSMLLNLLRVEQLRIEDMLKRSYVESNSLRKFEDRQKQLKNIKIQLEEMQSTECTVCVPDRKRISANKTSLREYHDALVQFVKKRWEIWPMLNGEISINRLLAAGRFLIVSNAKLGLRNDVAILLKELTGTVRTLQILVPVKDCNEMSRLNNEAEEYLKLPKKEQEWIEEENALIGTVNNGLYGGRTTPNDFESFRICEIPLASIVTILKKVAKSINSAEIVQEFNMKLMPRFRNQPVSESVRKLLNQISTVSIGLNRNEIDAYRMSEMQNLCSNIDISFDISLISTFESELEDANLFAAKHCTRFEEHFAKLREKVKIERAAGLLQYELSSDSLLLSEEYQNRLEVLEELGFVENDRMVSLRGRIACEIHHQELLITELILNNRFHTRPPAELAALLSPLTCQYNSGKTLKFEKGSVFDEIREVVLETMNKLETRAARHGAQIAELGCEIRFDLMEVVYYWADGMPFSRIMEMTEAQEGLIVKCIQRLDEVCKDIRNAARIVGDTALVEKMEEVSASIRRDIVFAASLYTSI